MTTITHTTQAGAFAAQLFDANDQSLAVIDRTPDPAMASETARRLAACWNACQGVATEQLEDLRVPLAQMVLQTKQERDTLRTTFAAMPPDIPLRMKRKICVSTGWSGSLVSRAYYELRARFMEEPFPIPQEADIAAQRDALRTHLQAVISGWRHGDDIVGPMNAAKQYLDNQHHPAPRITTTRNSGCGSVRCNFVEIEPFGSRCTVCNFTIPF